ncbi:UNVERIFIED_CONTAM: Copia protein [Sesamum latifolium]|uniref:Copia protein n=1 Tax=Sesamum latifolium TaxID=2727402 RepID=A0AAW2UGG1_9LAMI
MIESVIGMIISDLASTLIMRFTSQKHTGLNGVREHIMQMRDIVAQLKSLEVDMSESVLVHYILNTLSSQYAPFKISYNTHKDKWSINKLMTMCVQEEGRLSIEAGESVHMAIQGKNKDQAKGNGKAKGETLDAFKVYKAEVEKQCDKQIKIVRSDRGGEYFGRYTERAQAPGPFAKFLAEQGIVAQYTMPGSPDQNGVAERRNRTLLDMVQNMMASSKLHKSLWIDALKTAVYILNRVPTKAVSKTPFELFKVHNTPTVQTRVEQPIQTVPQVDDHEPVDLVVPHIPKNVKQPVDQQAHPENVDATLRRSARIKRSAIPGDYMVYLQESEFNIGAENDPETFSQAMISRESNLWYDAMKDEMNYMAFNEVWDLVELPDDFKAIGYKWVFKTKKTHWATSKDIKQTCS